MSLRTSRLALALAMLLPAAAAADSLQEAAVAFDRGHRLFSRGDYVGAIVAFERAFVLRRHHVVLCSIALCHERMSRFVEAAAHYRRCLEEGASATAEAAEIRKALAKVEARVSWLEVKSSQPGAGRVHVDGLEVGPPPRHVALNPGKHLVEVRGPGSRAARLAVQILSGERRAVTLSPEEEQEAKRASVRREPPPAPPRPTTLEGGAAKSRGRRTLRTGWFWTAVALTASLGAASAIVGGLTYKAHSDYYDAPTTEGYDRFVNQRLATNILFGLAAAAAGAGTVLYFYTDFGGTRAGAQDPRAAGAAAGIGLRGSF